MGMQRLYIDGEILEFKKLGNSKAWEFKQSNGTLTLKNGTYVMEEQVHLGEFISVACTGKTTEVVHMVLPQNPVREYLWIHGVPKANVYYGGKSVFDETFIKIRAEAEKGQSEQFVSIESKHCALFLIGPEKGDQCKVKCWIDSKASVDDVNALFEMTYNEYNIWNLLSAKDRYSIMKKKRGLKFSA